MERKTPGVKIKNKGVEVRELEETAVAYVRHTGPYQGDEDLFSRLFQSLFAWAGPRGLLDQPDLKVLAVYHDNPDITDDDKLRVSVCISVPAETEVSGEVGKMVIPGGKYAFARFSVNAEEYGAAWDWTFSRWLPESGYQPDDRPCFELYQSDPKQSPDGKTDVDIVIPVKPL